MIILVKGEVARGLFIGVKNVLDKFCRFGLGESDGPEGDEHREVDGDCVVQKCTHYYLKGEAGGCVGGGCELLFGAVSGSVPSMWDIAASYQHHQILHLGYPLVRKFHQNPFHLSMVVV